MLEQDLVLRAMSKSKYLFSNPTIGQRRVLIQALSSGRIVVKVCLAITNTLRQEGLHKESIAFKNHAVALLDNINVLSKERL